VAAKLTIKYQKVISVVIEHHFSDADLQGFYEDQNFNEHDIEVFTKYPCEWDTELYDYFIEIRNREPEYVYEDEPEYKNYNYESDRL
jgi:hypothetical protein